MSNETVLVTGASGFTGGHLARRLARNGHTVRALIRSPVSPSWPDVRGIEFVQGDVRDPAAMRAAATGVDTVYHIAAAYRQEGIERQHFFDINATGTENVLAAALEAGARRVVHCSTVGVHGDVQNAPADEEAPYAPGDHYQQSKLEGEMIARHYQKDTDLAVTICRPGAIYGPGDLRFLKLFRAIKKRRFLMIGSGEVAYHLTFIDDLVDGLLLCGTREEAVGETFIIAGKTHTTLNEITSHIAEELEVTVPRLRLPVWPFYWAGYCVEHVCRAIRVEPFLYRRRVDFFVKSRAFDITKARTLLNYAPKVGVREGVHRTAEWYRRQGLLAICSLLLLKDQALLLVMAV
ncbi:MAG: NAD-dependent epimerase/dehydratase family protein [Rhodospirillales bacterium]|nr:NAD-dependent epimerase/dehydratase family protein [Rhodospirillales bacterium]